MVVGFTSLMPLIVFFGGRSRQIARKFWASGSKTSKIHNHPQSILSNTEHNRSPKLVLRPATIKDAPILRAWDEKEYLKAISGDEEFNDWDWENELQRTPPWRLQFMAVPVESEENSPIGFVQIIDPLLEDTHYWGEDCEANLRAIDIWIGEEDYLGRGYGTAMMTEALFRCFGDEGVVGVLVDPMSHNERAHGFYQKFGFRPIGIRFFGPDKCLVHRLDRVDWEKASKSGKKTEH